MESSIRSHLLLPVLLAVNVGLVACSGNPLPPEVLEDGEPHSGATTEKDSTAGSSDNPDNDDPLLNLDGDTLAPPPAPVLKVAAKSGELILSWERADETSVVSLELYNRQTRTTTTLVEAFNPDTTEHRIDIENFTFQWQHSEFVLSVCPAADDSLISDCLRSYNQGVSDLSDKAVVTLELEQAADFDLFSSSVAISDNASVVVAGAPGRERLHPESSTPVFDAGIANLYFNVENQWWLGAQLSALQPQYNARFGSSLALDDLGDTVVVGAPLEQASYTSNDDLNIDGAAYVFARAGETWIQKEHLRAPIPQQVSYFGKELDISGDASTIAIVAHRNPRSVPTDSSSHVEPTSSLQDSLLATIKLATTTTKDHNPSAFDGVVYLFETDAATGTPQVIATLEGSESDRTDSFGFEIQMDNDANTLAIAAPDDQPGSDPLAHGAIYLYQRLDGTYPLLQKLTSSSLAGTLQFATAMSLSDDGSTLISSNHTRPEQQGQLGTFTEKPQIQLEIYRKTEGGEFVLSTRLTPAGTHGYDTRIALASNGEGNLITASITSQDTGNSTITVFKFEDQRWQTLNVIENPGQPGNEFAKHLAMSASGRRLVVSAPGTQNASGLLYLY